MLVFIGWVISYANEWEDYSNYLGDGAETSWIWATAHSLVLVTWNCHGTSGCVISLADSGSRSSLVYHLWSHLILISLCCVLGLCHSLKSCVLLLTLITSKTIFPVPSSSLNPTYIQGVYMYPLLYIST